MDGLTFVVTYPEGPAQTYDHGTYTTEERLRVTCADEAGVRWSTETALGEPCTLESLTAWMMTKAGELALAVQNNVVTFSLADGTLSARGVTSPRVVGQSSTWGAPMYFLADGAMEPMMQSLGMLYSEIRDMRYDELDDRPALLTDAKDGTMLVVLADQPQAVKTLRTNRDMHMAAVARMAADWSWRMDADGRFVIGARRTGDGTEIVWLETAGLTETAACEAPVRLQRMLGVTGVGAQLLWQGQNGTCYRTGMDGETMAFAAASRMAHIASAAATADMPMQLAIAEAEERQVRFAVFADGVPVSEGTADLPGAAGDCVLSDLRVQRSGVAAIRWQTETDAGWLVYEPTTGQTVTLRDDKPGSRPAFVCLAGTQDRLASADADGAVRILDANTGAALASTPPFSAGVTWMTFLDSDRLLLALTGDHLLVGIETATGEVRTAATASKDLKLPAVSRVCELSDEVVLWADDGSPGGVIIDRASMTIKAEIPDMVGYASPSSMVITRYGTEMAGYRKYTLEELVAWGEERVKDRPLDQVEEIKAGLWRADRAPDDRTE